jgi:pentose-5-phosphate-3-epimerase
MTAVSETSELRIAPWASAFEQGTISGSVYAVPASLRVEAARILTDQGQRVHIDFIVTEDGSAVGVTPEDLLRISKGVPQARFDAHLILPEQHVTDAVLNAAASAIHALEQVQAETFALSPQAMETFANLLPSLRERNVAIWTEIPVGTEPAHIDHADGALVMLIESGTRNEADRSQLRKVTALAGTTSVGIDGGVTATLAADARKAGASVIVCGRALFEITKKRKASHGN